MALEFDSQDAIPEGLREDFTEIGGRWVPKGYIPEGVHAEMKQRAERSRARLSELEEQAKGWDGIDPEKARKAAEEAEQLRKQLATMKTGKTDDELERVVRERYEHELAKHRSEMEARDAEVKKLQEQAGKAEQTLGGLIIETHVGEAWAKLGDLHPAALSDGHILVRSLFEVEEVDGQRRPVMRTSDGGIRQGKNGALTVREFLEGTRDTESPYYRPHWWKASGSGGGANGAQGTGGGVVVLSEEAARDPAAYRAAKERAEKMGVPLQLSR